MTVRSLVTTRPTTDQAPGSGFASPFPVILGGTEALRTLRTTAPVVNALDGPKVRNLETVKP